MDVRQHFHDPVTLYFCCKVYMDDLVEADEHMGQLKVAVLVPTCGEKTATLLKAMFGNLQLRYKKTHYESRSITNDCFT